MKKIISVIILSALLIMIISGCSVHKQESDVQKADLIFATDLHYLSPELTDHGACFENTIENADGKTMEYCDEIVDAFVNDVITQKPDALVLSGDLTFNGEKISHETLAKKLKKVRNAGISVFVMPGNHDLDNIMAVSYEGDGYNRTDSVTAEEFSKIYRDFGYSKAYSRDEHSLSYIAKISSDLCLLMVDVNASDIPGSVCDETLEWIEKQLVSAQKKGMRVISVSHQNLLQHTPLFSSGFVMYNNDKLTELLEKYNVICHFSGHLHTQHIAQSKNGFTEIVTSSMMVAPLQYGVLSLDGTKGQYSTRQVNVSSEIEEYAKKFFWDTACRQALEELNSDEDINNMASYFADINSAYFSGNMDTAEYDAELLDMWKDEHTFMSSYLQSMSVDSDKNYNEFSFEIKE